MKTKTVLIWSFILSLAALAVGLILSPRFPDPMAIHWDAHGQPNGYGSHFMGLWFVPLLVIGLVLLLMAIPHIDPLKKNIEKFRKEYNTFVFIFVIFFVYIYLLSLVLNLGLHFNLFTWMVPAIGGFFYYIGILMGKAKRNYFIGIRTPWTLADEDVWNQTHRVGSIAFKISGVVTILGVVFQNFAIWFVIVPALLASVYPIVYSYVAYRKLHPNDDNEIKP